jgi:hypothetical protein
MKGKTEAKKATNYNIEYYRQRRSKNILMVILLLHFVISKQDFVLSKRPPLSTSGQYWQPWRGIQRQRGWSFYKPQMSKQKQWET